jgi:FkbM family methyltransferase
LPDELFTLPAEPVSERPYLSVVVTTRNDDHGGDPLKRLQLLVQTFDEQCGRFGLDAELIVVEWNPPSDRPRVGELLRVPEPIHCPLRFIEVPPELHHTLKHADVLPLFQMIAKNVGVRRARGRFVLATNIDIVFSNELVEFMAAGMLQPRQLYRVDRHDVQADVPAAASLEEQLAFCRSHQLRVHTRWGSYPVDADGRLRSEANDVVDGRTVRLGRGWHVREGGGDSASYRWASERTELIVEPPSPSLSGGPVVLDLLLESNPYDPQAWVELAVTDGARSLAQARIAGRARLVVPMHNLTGETSIQLKVTDCRHESRRSLPAFERRDGLHYRMISAELRMSLAGEVLQEFPLAGWSSANSGSGVRVQRTTDGVAVETDSRKWSYAVEYGPLSVLRGGRHRFEVSCSVGEGAIIVGILDGGRDAWLPSTVMDAEVDRVRCFEITADLDEGQQCWIVFSNNHPNGDGISRFVLHSLKGSADCVVATGDRSSPRRDRRRGGGTSPKSRRQLVSSLVDSVAERIASTVSGRIRYRIIRNAPEYQALEQALRASDERLREIAPLQYLSAFNSLLADYRPENLHLNGCGDFQLMARDDWDEIRGYAEFETFSMNIDGVLSVAADAAGIKEQLLEMPIYHLEHELGSGWSPEGEAVLRRRIAESGITWLDAPTVYVWAVYMRWLGRSMIFNPSNWGFADHALSERVCSRTDGERRMTRSAEAPRHPVFDRFGDFEGWAEPGFERSFYGSNIRDWLYTGTSKGLTDRRYVRVGHPPVDEEYFEWIALLTSVIHAQHRFVFAELGAGWGRWMVSAAAACRQQSVPFSLIGVEPEPSHFDWLRMVLADNDINPEEHELFLGAVGTRDGELILAGPDEPRTAYGNRTIDQQQLASWENIKGYIFRPVTSVTLEALFSKHDTIDLVDMDVQGTEGEIVSEGIDVLNRKVRMIHIGTHSAAVEAELTAVFTAHRWLKAFSFRSQTTTNTLFGAVTFGDGVQTWVNPRWPKLHEALVARRPA